MKRAENPLISVGVGPFDFLETPPQIKKSISNSGVVIMNNGKRIVNH